MRASAPRSRIERLNALIERLERMYRGPLNVDELLAELHASENDPKDRAFLGAGRRCRGGEVAAPASSDVDIAMSRMKERLNQLNGEMQVQPNGPCRPGLPPRHGRRAGVAAAADEPAARRRGGDELVGGTELAELAALEQAARLDSRRETALRQRVAALHQQLEPVAATAPAAEGVAVAAVAVKRPAAPAAAEAQGELSAAVGRRVAQLKRQASARAAVLDGLESEARRLQQQLQQQQLQQQQQQQQVVEERAPPAAAPTPAAAPMAQPARLLCMLRRINGAGAAARAGAASGTAPAVPAA